MERPKARVMKARRRPWVTGLKKKRGFEILGWEKYWVWSGLFGLLK